MMMNKHVVLIIALLLLSTLEIAVFYLIKTYHNQSYKDVWYMILACYLYACIPLVLLFVLNQGGSDSIGLVNATWNVLSISYGVLLDYIVFGVTFTSMSIAGLVVGIGSLVLINWDSFH